MTRGMAAWVGAGTVAIAGSLFALNVLGGTPAGSPRAVPSASSDTLWTLNLDGVSPRAGAYWGPRATGSAMVGWSPMFKDSLEREFGPALYNTRTIVLVTEDSADTEVVITIGGWDMDRGLDTTGTYTLGHLEGEIAFDAMKVAMAGDGPSHNSFMSGDGRCTPDYCYPPPSSFTITRFDREWIEGGVSGRFWTLAKAGGIEDVFVTIVFKAHRCIVETTRWRPTGRTRECVPIP